ncbi:hypothetical protein ACFU99_28315 [Streptomyces sp. NPDC057654]|uniref:hypothetical protein n=1 Tax=Streptomyces sp. NPDC057654 TaxID=3346196 RepID=UPI00368C57B4
MDNIGLRVVGIDDADHEELHELSMNLRRHLLERGIDDVRIAGAGALPERAKAGQALAVGALVVSLAPLLVRDALHAVETWMQNRPVRSVTVTLDGRSIELGHASPEDQQRLIEGFLNARASVDHDGR